jgi:6-phosphogluconolactonase (cycloisomerase 2 family)
MFLKSAFRAIALAVIFFSTAIFPLELRISAQMRSAAPDTTGLNNASAVLCPSSGAFIYIGGFSLSRVTQFARSGSDTTLTFVASTDSLRFNYGMALSPDEKFLYIATYYSNTIECYSRNEMTGVLTFSHRTEINPNNNWFLYPTRLRMDKTGQNLYVVSDNSLSVFTRNIQSGALEFRQMLTDEKGNITELAGISDVDISPDGKFAYVASGGDSSVSWYQRDAATGMLTFSGMLHGGANSSFVLIHPDNVRVSPNGDFAVVSAGGGAIAGFSRNPATGALVFTNELLELGSNKYGIYEANDFCFFAQGTRIVTAAAFASGLISMDTATGALHWLEAVTIPAKINFMHFGRGVAVSPDNKRIFIAGSEGSLTQLEWTNPSNAIRSPRVARQGTAVEENLPLVYYNLLGKRCTADQTGASGIYVKSVVLFNQIQRHLCPCTGGRGNPKHKHSF